MSMLRLLSGLLVAASLAACANPKKPLEDYEYERQATRAIGIQRCAADGNLSPQSAMWAQRQMNHQLTFWQVDYSRLSQTIADLSRRSGSPTREQCSGLAIAAAQFQSNVEEGNRQVAQEQQNIQNYINNNQIQKPVFCNRIGNQVLCN